MRLNQSVAAARLTTSSDEARPASLVSAFALVASLPAARGPPRRYHSTGILWDSAGKNGRRHAQIRSDLEDQSLSFNSILMASGSSVGARKIFFIFPAEAHEAAGPCKVRAPKANGRPGPKRSVTRGGHFTGQAAP